MKNNLRTKVFLQDSPFWLIWQVALMILPIWFFVDFIIKLVNGEELNVTEIVMVALADVVFIIIVYALERHRLVFRKDKCSVPNGWDSKHSRVQFKTDVYYNEITDIKLIVSANNSLDKRITGWLPSNSVRKPYLEFTCADGTKKRIFVMYFTKRLKRKIIDEFKFRMKAVGNDAEIEDTNEIIAKQGKIMIEV